MIAPPAQLTERQVQYTAMKVRIHQKLVERLEMRWDQRDVPPPPRDRPPRGEAGQPGQAGPDFAPEGGGVRLVGGC